MQGLILVLSSIKISSSELSIHGHTIMYHLSTVATCELVQTLQGTMNISKGREPTLTSLGTFKAQEKHLM